jgi:hypothetical protein
MVADCQLHARALAAGLPEFAPGALLPSATSRSTWNTT